MNDKHQFTANVWPSTRNPGLFDVSYRGKRVVKGVYENVALTVAKALSGDDSEISEDTKEERLYGWARTMVGEKTGRLEPCKGATPTVPDYVKCVDCQESYPVIQGEIRCNHSTIKTCYWCPHG